MGLLRKHSLQVPSQAFPTHPSMKWPQAPSIQNFQSRPQGRHKVIHLCTCHWRESDARTQGRDSMQKVPFQTTGSKPPIAVYLTCPLFFWPLHILSVSSPRITCFSDSLGLCLDKLSLIAGAEALSARGNLNAS